MLTYVTRYPDKSKEGFCRLTKHIVLVSKQCCGMANLGKQRRASHSLWH